MENRYDSSNRNKSNLVFALAYELQQYVETNADELDPDLWDSINHWRAGILSQGVITEEDLLEIIEYIGAEKLQELIELANSKTINNL